MTATARPAATCGRSRGPSCSNGAGRHGRNPYDRRVRARRTIATLRIVPGALSREFCVDVDRLQLTTDPVGYSPLTMKEQIVRFIDVHNVSLPTIAGACFALGVPGSILILFGGLHLVRRAGSGPDVRDRLAVTLVIGSILLLGFAVLQHALEVPYYSVVKSSFSFPVLAPLGLCLAVGIQRVGASLDRRLSRLVTAIAHGWLAALGLALLLAVLG